MKKVFIEQNLTESIILDKETTHHVLNVLRFNTKEELLLGNALGESAFYKFVAMVKHESEWQLVSSIEKEVIEAPIILIASFLKGDKFEYVLQKTTELDVTEILALPTKNSVVKYDLKKLDKKEERWNKIIREAAQQSGRSNLAKYQSFANFKEINAYIDEKYPNSLKLVAYENEDDLHIKDLIRPNYEGEKLPVVIAIGPEGGFDLKEVENLAELGFKAVTLGKNILRAETAAISSVAMINYERSN